MLFFSARPFYDGILGAGGVAGNSYEGAGDTCPGGKAYLAADFAKLATDPWIRFANVAARIGTTDHAVTLRFSEFTPVPEPSSYGTIACVAICAVILRHSGLLARAGSMMKKNGHADKLRLPSRYGKTRPDPNGASVGKKTSSGKRKTRNRTHRSITHYLGNSPLKTRRLQLASEAKKKPETVRLTWADSAGCERGLTRIVQPVPLRETPPRRTGRSVL